jgi:addiction module RelB/DinJ family antitoxin
MIMANGKSTVNVKIDTGVKELATHLLERMGLDQTRAIDMFYRQIIAERRLPFQPTVAQTYGEQMLDIIRRKDIPHKAVEVNAEGHIIVDKDKDPELYDWAVNG